MSNLVIPDVSKKPRATILLAGTVHKKVHLFKNNATISHSTVLTDLTEANFSGYAAVNLSGGAVAASLDASGRAVISWDTVSWTKSGATGNTIYGYYLTDNADLLSGVEKWDNPIDMSTDGLQLAMTPKDTTASQFSNT